MVTIPASTSAILSDTDLRRRENRLYQEVFPNLVDYYSAHVHNRTLAKELAQVAMSKVMTKLHQYNPSQPFMNWWVRIARNYLFDYYRQRACHKRQMLDYVSDYPDRGGNDGKETRNWLQEHAIEDPNQEAQMLSDQLMTRLRDWPGRDGEIARRHLLEGEKILDVARDLGIKMREVEAVVAQVRATLRRELEMAPEEEEYA